MLVETSAYARIGLLGNPSDGYFGKTISCAIRNFKATVFLEANDHVLFVPHPQFDPFEFDSLSHLRATAVREGYSGGYRLLYATCKKFADYCARNGIALADKGFTIRYDTTIPRQVGLAGSSAIVTAVILALREFYGISDEQLPKPVQPSLVLSVEEEELDIRAGLQDRVIQTYGGVVYMDFDRQLIEKRGYGEYIPLSPFNLPPLFLAYVDKPKDSGRVHSDVRARWMRGDQDVVDAMRTFAGFAEAGKDALARKDWDALSLLMNQNFDLRLRLFGEKVIGERDLELVSIGRSLGAPTKFSGSGGAVVGIWRDKEQLESLRARYIQQGFAFTDVQVDAGTHRIA